MNINNHSRAFKDGSMIENIENIENGGFLLLKNLNQIK
jgi:hypothetical protein